MFNFPNNECFCKVSCLQIGFLSYHVTVVIRKGGKIYMIMEVMVKKMTTPMLWMLIRKWRLWNLTKGSIRVMEWASGQVHCQLMDIGPTPSCQISNGFHLTNFRRNFFDQHCLLRFLSYFLDQHHLVRFRMDFI